MVAVNKTSIVKATAPAAKPVVAVKPKSVAKPVAKPAVKSVAKPVVKKAVKPVAKKLPAKAVKKSLLGKIGSWFKR